MSGYSGETDVVDEPFDDRADSFEDLDQVGIRDLYLSEPVDLAGRLRDAVEANDTLMIGFLLGMVAARGYGDKLPEDASPSEEYRSMLEYARPLGVAASRMESLTWYPIPFPPRVLS